MRHPGDLLREELAAGREIEPFLGIYDCLSASVAAPYSPNLFLSGFAFSAAHYGLPDIGYIAWSDIVASAWRLRQIVPRHRLLVDIDDGYVDVHTARHVVRQLEAMGVAMVMMEDQARPRRCGHVDGKQLLPLPAYLDKLNAVLADRSSICILARTDTTGEDIFRRVEAMSRTEADVLLVDGVDSIETLERVCRSTEKPLLFNQIAGGKSPRLGIEDLRQLGVRMVQYSTPLLFAAQRAMTEALDALFANGGLLPNDFAGGDINVAKSLSLMQANAPPPGRDANEPSPLKTARHTALVGG